VSKKEKAINPYFLNIVIDEQIISQLPEDDYIHIGTTSLQNNVDNINSVDNLDSNSSSSVNNNSAPSNNVNHVDNVDHVEIIPVIIVLEVM